MTLRPNAETSQFAVPSGVVGGIATNLLALGFGATINLPLCLAGCGCLLIAIGMEAWSAYRGAQ